MRVFFNEDMTHFWMTRFEKNIDVTQKVLKDFIYQYKGTTVTDFLMNVNASVSVPESDYFDTFAEKYLKTEENGVPVDYKNTYARLHYNVFYEKGLDPFGIWTKALWDCGINPWISFRMNDIHNSMDKAALLKASFTEAHPELWNVTHRPAMEYFDRCLNYLKPEVQGRMLGFIEEQLSRYDVYGIELDFGREPYCFPAGKEAEGRAAMLDFCGKVKTITERIGRERGREIKIGMICQCNPITAYNTGFDVAEIAKRGYVDFVTAGPRWATINTAVPVEMWKKLLPESVSFAGLQQLLVTGYPFSKNIMSDYEMALGQASAFTTRGADFVYLYNCFDILEECCNVFNHPNSIREHHDDIIANIGKTENRKQWNRRFPLTYDDFTAWCQPLEVTLPSYINNPKFPYLMRITTGLVERDETAYYNIETDRPIDTSKLTIYVNGVKAEPVSDNKNDPYIVKQNGYSFSFNAKINDVASVEIVSQIEFKIEYAEIYVGQ